MKIGFVSLGCPKNLVDSEVMMGQLVSRGHELTPHPDQADVLVVNTCSFIDPAKQESVDTILEMAEYKKIGRAKKLIVAGCLVERYRGDIQRDMPEVDALIGTNELDRIAALCEGWADDAAPDPAPAYLYHDLTPRVLATPGHYAYIKIAEGCDHPCTFCVIPQYRGKFRSRRFESVIAEATRLFQQGVREINLIGSTARYPAAGRISSIQRCPGCKPSVCEVPFREILSEPGVPVSSDVFVEKVQQNLDFRCQARWTREKCAQGERFRDPLGQNGYQTVANVWAFRHP